MIVFILKLDMKDLSGMENLSNTIYVKAKEGCMPEQHGDWIDLFTAEDTYVDSFSDTEPYPFRLIPLGVCIKLPEGYEANIVPRSSTFLKYGIIQANHFGVIDNAYCGDNDEWKFPAIALRNTFIPKGTRICQFRLNKIQPPVNMIEVESLNGPNRGGFGSTGS